jgi:predicted lactoylglutathione lyase
MTTNIFVHLPVKDLPKTKEFFGKLGFKFNAQFTDKTVAYMIVSENPYVMLLTHPKFKEFAPNAVADATKSTEVLVGAQ